MWDKSFNFLEVSNRYFCQLTFNYQPFSVLNWRILRRTLFLSGKANWFLALVLCDKISVLPFISLWSLVNLDFLIYKTGIREPTYEAVEWSSQQDVGRSWCSVHECFQALLSSGENTNTRCGTTSCPVKILPVGSGRWCFLITQMTLSSFKSFP